ncbi:hypothetical protein QOT17_011521 [Balamuthia mandrillaris]
MSGAVRSLFQTVRKRKSEEPEEFEEPLDEDEQQQVIQQLVESNRQMNARFSAVFMLVGLVLAAIKFYCAFSHFFYPFQLPFHFFLEDVISGPALFIFEFNSALSFLCCAVYMRPPPQTFAPLLRFFGKGGAARSRDKGKEKVKEEDESDSNQRTDLLARLSEPLTIGALMLLPSLLYCVPLYLMVDDVELKRMVWVVGANVLFLALCYYLKRLMKSSEHDAMGLNKYTYTFKRA